jgi:hypothetical protein
MFLLLQIGDSAVWEALRSLQGILAATAEALEVAVQDTYGDRSSEQHLAEAVRELSTELNSKFSNYVRR